MDELTPWIEKYLFWNGRAASFVTDPTGANPALSKAERIKQGAILKFQIKSSEFDRKVREYEKARAIEVKEALSDLQLEELQEDRNKVSVQ